MQYGSFRGTPYLEHHPVNLPEGLLVLHSQLSVRHALRSANGGIFWNGILSAQ